MATFLLLWNPEKWAWPALDQGVVADRIRLDLGYDEPWTTGTRARGIVPGDRVFLLKTGAEPRGLIAAGLVTSEIYLAPHWDARRQGLVPHVDVRWTEVAGSSGPLPYPRLREAVPDLPRLVVGGGVFLDETTASAVESQWTAHSVTAAPGPSVSVRGRSVTRQAVLRVLREYAALGQEQFLGRHGFQPSRRYWLQHEGRLYESKAVLCVAAGLRSAEFSGGRATTLPLERLGFTIVEPAIGDPAGPATELRPPFTPRDSRVQVSPGIASTADPDVSGRGLRAHRELENWLARTAASAGLHPEDPSLTDPPFDLAWRDGDELTVVEVKSITSGNETSQLRLGLGQILEYACMLRGVTSVRPVLFVERAPSADHWEAVCQSAGVELWWPGTAKTRIGGKRMPASLNTTAEAATISAKVCPVEVS